MVIFLVFFFGMSYELVTKVTIVEEIDFYRKVQDLVRYGDISCVPFLLNRSITIPFCGRSLDPDQIFSVILPQLVHFPLYTKIYTTKIFA